MQSNVLRPSEFLYSPGFNVQIQYKGRTPGELAKDILKLKNQNETLHKELERKIIRNESLTKEMQTLRTSHQVTEVIVFIVYVYILAPKNFIA